MDINFDNVVLDQEYSVSIGDNPTMAQGNKLLANIFEITFMTSLNDSLLSYGYGADGVGVIRTGFNPNDLQSIASMVKVASDNTVLMMKADQNNISKTEKIVSAYVDNVNKVQDNVSVNIRIIPEEYEQQYMIPGIILTLPL